METIKINDELLQEVITKDKKVLIDCYATWCGPCKMLSPIIDEVANEISDVKFYKIDVDENEKVSATYKIMSIPTLLLFEDGKLKEKHIGFMSKDELKKFINS